MPELKISIKSITEWTTAPITDMTLVGADILENGTSGGRPVIYLRLIDAEGNEHVAAITARLLDGLNGASLGAQKRWEFNKKNN